ncbi:MAG TPA: DUF4192 family protein [Jatrophihabitans sp.]|jgi:hypothetical protein|uniref:DUF4192 family protein n=1 Tax=Jatrophihabitans sp. TaxID=1932789 RepID=UPI002E06F415|nr:DUF4192 family protein [Jatrophihabitans sp.]
MPTTDPTQVHVASPTDLLTAIPTMLGTPPKECLVLVGVSETTVTAAALIELRHVASPGVMPAAFHSIRRSFATGVIVVVYTDTHARTDLLAEPLETLSVHVNLEMEALLLVRRGELQPLA